MVALSTHHAPLSPDEARLLDALCRPDASFAQIAHDHGLTVPDLTLWMARPDIAAQLHALESACAVRARLIAAAYLPQAAVALGRIVYGFNHGGPRAPGHESARRASSLLLRIANFTPGATTRRPTNTRDPRPGTAGSALDQDDAGATTRRPAITRDLRPGTAGSALDQDAGASDPQPPSHADSASSCLPASVPSAATSTPAHTSSPALCPVPYALMPSSVSTTTAPEHPEAVRAAPGPHHEPSRSPEHARAP